MLRSWHCCRLRCLTCQSLHVGLDVLVLAAVVMQLPIVALLSLQLMGPSLVAIFVVVVETFDVIFVGMVLVMIVLGVVSSAGMWFRSLGRSVWTSTRCLCLHLHLCCLWRCLAKGLRGRRRRGTRRR